MFQQEKEAIQPSRVGTGYEDVTLELWNISPSDKGTIELGIWIYENDYMNSPVTFC